MKAVIFATLVALSGCDPRPADSKTEAGSGSNRGAPGAAAPTPAHAETAPPAAPASRPDLTGAPRLPALPHRAESGEQIERLRTTLREMDDLVTQLSSGRATPRNDECKQIRRLEELSRSLSAPDIAEGPSAGQGWSGKRAFLDMTIDDIVDGRCGPRPISRHEDLADFYQSLHRYLGDMLAMCERSTPTH